MNKISSSTFILSVLIFVLYCIMMPQWGLDYDVQCWKDWTGYIFDHGLQKAYDSGANYLPGHLYEMKLLCMFYKTKQHLLDHIYYLKFFTLLFDVAGALLVCSLVKEAASQKLVLLAILLNPSWLHNTMGWGQFDSVFSTLAFASFIAVYKRKYIPGILLYLLSLNFKFQAIVFLPALSLLILHKSETLKINWKLILQCVLATVLVETLILTPFILNHSAERVLGVIKSYSGEYSTVSLNAANLWQLLLNVELRWLSDEIAFIGIPIKKWGLILFATTLSIALVPLLESAINRLYKKTTEISLEKLLLIFALSPLVFFYFNSQMHERYSFPAFIFIAAYSALTGRWWLYILFSAAYFLNNEKMLHSTTIINYNATAFDFKFISGLFLFIIIVLIGYLFVSSKKEKLA